MDSLAGDAADGSIAKCDDDATIPRPVVFVVNATAPGAAAGGGEGTRERAAGGRRIDIDDEEDDEPFDVRGGTSTLASSIARGVGGYGGDDDEGRGEGRGGDFYGRIMSALMWGDGGGEKVMDVVSDASSSRRLNTGLSLRRWSNKASSTGRDVPALDRTECDHPRGENGFLSERARIVSVSPRHAFPPSKFPRGKMMDASSSSVHGGGMGSTIMLGEQQHSSGGMSTLGAWMSSYDVQSEGILHSGWLEKHCMALPSARGKTMRSSNNGGVRRQPCSYRVSEPRHLLAK